jgi:hypothetical protein
MEMLKEILVELGWIWGPLIAMGVGLDLFTIKFGKAAHHRLTRWWLRLAKTRVPKLARKLALRTVRLLPSPIATKGSDGNRRKLGHGLINT